MEHRHETYDNEGNIIEVVDTRTLEGEKRRVIEGLKQEVKKELEVSAPLFEQINALEGRYDADKAKKVKEKVDKLRKKYINKRDAVMAMMNIEDVEKVGWQDYEK